MVKNTLNKNVAYAYVIICIAILSSCTIHRDGLKQKYSNLNKVPVSSSEHVLAKDFQENKHVDNEIPLTEVIAQSDDLSHEGIGTHSENIKSDKSLASESPKRKLSGEKPLIKRVFQAAKPDFQEARAMVSELTKNPSADPMTILIWILIILLIAAVLSILGLPLLELLVTILVIVLLVMLIMYLYYNL